MITRTCSRIIACAFCLALLTIFPASIAQSQPTTAPRNVKLDHAALKKLGWQMAVRTAIFKDLSVFEALDFYHPLTVHHVEVSFNQPLTPDHPDWRVTPDMPAEQVDALMAKLKGMKMDIVSYHAGATPGDEPKARQVFELAKKLGAKTIVCEPEPDALSMMDKLANEYGINVAITNAAAPAQYPDCHALITATAGRSNRFGAAADVVQLRGSGDNPKQCMVQLKGHVIEVRLHDVSAHKDDIEATLKQLKGDGFKGAICVDALGNSADDAKGKVASAMTDLSDLLTVLAK